MIKNSPQAVLLQKLFELLEAHCGDFRQERVYWRSVGMVLGELFNFGKRTVTQMMSVGVLGGDSSAWYRIFSRERYSVSLFPKLLLRVQIGSSFGELDQLQTRISDTSLRIARPRCHFARSHSSTMR